MSALQRFVVYSVAIAFAFVATAAFGIFTADSASAAACGEHYGKVMPGSEGTACPPELEEPKPTPKPEPKPEPKPTPKPEPKPKPKPKPKPEVTPKPAPAPETNVANNSVSRAPKSSPRVAPAAPAAKPAPKKSAPKAKPVEVEEEPESVIEEIVEEEDNTPELCPAPEAAEPVTITKTVYETKFPWLAVVLGALLGGVGSLRLFMRNGHQWNDKFRRVVAGPNHHHRLDDAIAEVEADEPAETTAN